MANVLAIGDLERAMARAGGWIAASVAPTPTPTTTTFAITGYSLTGAPSLAGAIVIVGYPTRQVGSVASIAGSTLTLSTALANAPTAGDPVAIYPLANINATVSENVADVGGVAVPIDFAGNPVLPTTQFDQLVQDGTIQGTQIGFVASGDEVSYATLTVDGTWRVNGAAYLGTLVVNLGGTVIVGDTGSITTGSY